MLHLRKPEEVVITQPIVLTFGARSQQRSCVVLPPVGWPVNPFCEFRILRKSRGFPTLSWCGVPCVLLLHAGPDLRKAKLALRAQIGGCVEGGVDALVPQQCGQAA